MKRGVKPRRSSSPAGLTSMPSGELARRIRRLRPGGRTTESLERALAIYSRPVWYRTQKEHWLGWLGEYEGPGFYSRKTWGGRCGRYIYNHIKCAPMLLWLAEAAGVDKPSLARAQRAVLAAPDNGTQQCAALRGVLPWAAVEKALVRPSSGTFPSGQE